MEVKCQFYAPSAFPQGKSSGYPLNMKLYGSQSRYGRSGEEKTIFSAPTRNETHVTCSAVIVLRRHLGSKLFLNTQSNLKLRYSFPGSKAAGV